MTSTNHTQAVVSPWQPGLVGGFATGVALWTTWFITHLPWLGMSEMASKPILLAVWLIGATWTGLASKPRPIRGGLIGGSVAAVLGLLILGSRLAQPPQADGTSEGVIPQAELITVGFLGLGAVIGLIGGIVARAIPWNSSPDPDGDPGRWLQRFAWVTVLATAPLLFAGGLVTSTNTGMAVPDWPNTFGSNMFLYPLGPRADAGVYLEHAHRLFGTLVGITTLTLMIWVLRQERRGWVRGWAVGLFLGVCFQGILGGVRVLEGSADIAQDNRWWSMFHGVTAQVLFAAMVGMAAFLGKGYRDPEPAPGFAKSRRLRALANGALHATFVQLIFGAMYRHLRSDHALWTHAGFAVVVLALAFVAGLMIADLDRNGHGRTARALRPAGAWIVAVVTLQFLLGWVAFGFGGREIGAQTEVQALIRTVHQANGAALVALLAYGAMMSRKLAQVMRAPASA